MNLNQISAKLFVSSALVVGMVASAAAALEPTSSAPATVQVLTDSAQRTLYTLDSDTANHSNCEGDCLVEWPPFLVADGASAPTDTRIGSFARADGRKQYAINGKPLYYFDEDQKAGDALGSEDDGVWHVVPVAAPAPTPSPSPSPSPTVTPPVFAEVSGCKATDYVDAQADASIATGPGASYTPRCLRVHVGTSVKIGASAMHPLKAMAAVNGIVNPLNLPASGADAAVTQVFSASGFYGYFCGHHGTIQGTGMAGAIQVVP